MDSVKKILVFQTAFIGDVVLALPIVQALKLQYPDSEIDFVCIPSTSELLNNNPYINEKIIFDKRGTHKGIKGMMKLAKYLKVKKYDLVISPHRSVRTSIIIKFAKPRRSIGFNISGFSFLYNDKVEYLQYDHEIIRNLSLLKPMNIFIDDIIKPDLFPGNKESKKIDEVFVENGLTYLDKIVAIAPASVWFTKQYPKEKFLKIIQKLSGDDIKVVLIGGEKDIELKNYFNSNKSEMVLNMIGELSLLESAELLSRCTVLLTNDSAPLHIANSMGTLTIALFGATIPQFGFYPYGERDFIFETNGLKCRPCSIHGGDKCPVKTFDCMNEIDEMKVYYKIKEKLSGLD